MNEVRIFTDAIWEIHLNDSILDFLQANRRCNSATHALASHACMYQHSVVWLENHPPWVDCTLRLDFFL